ncbi:MAG TPA: tetratricopeptide repeat protein, partial [Candidatus Obscuribacterales bacterium]
MANSFDQALQAYKKGQYQESLSQFLQLVSQHPQDAKLRLWLAASHREAGQPEAAKQQFQEVLKLTTDSKLIDLARTSLAKLAKAAPPQVNSNAMVANVASHNGNGSGQAPSNGHASKVAQVSQSHSDTSANSAN